MPPFFIWINLILDNLCFSPINLDKGVYNSTDFNSV